MPSEPASENPAAGRAESLFQSAADLPEEARAAFLERECAGDGVLRAEVESLLRHLSAGRGDFLEHSPVAALEEPAPERVGRYRVLRVIGAGGMGMVYEAEQEHPRRVVALKVVRPGLATRQTLRRFHFESEVLGQLQHPGIAQIFEAGTAVAVAPGQDESSGRSVAFFAMEFVRGESLTRHAAALGLGVRERVDLLARVCDAVHHAHQKGVLHRDLKPANILVDETGQPKVLDFGVARLLGQGAEAATLATTAGELVGTFAYMSPEQAAGRVAELDTRSDVYALGVIMYELLGGRPPLDLSGQNLSGALRLIGEAEPPRIGSIRRELAGDLETITHAALAKDPNRRYGAASELAADLRRFLRDEPILARPAGAAYRARKFVSRNRALVGGVAATIVVLVLGIAGTGYGMVEMGRQRDLVVQQSAITARVNEFFSQHMLAAASAREEADRDIPLRVALDRAAAKIEGRFEDAPLVEASIRKTIGSTYRSLGRPDEAERHLSRAMALFSAERGEADPETLNCRSELAGILVDRTEYDRAEAEYVALLAVQRAALGDEHAQTIVTLTNLGSLYGSRSRFPEADSALSEALAICLRVHGEDHPLTASTMTNLASVHTYLGETARAVEMLERGLAIHEKVNGPEHPETLAAMSNLGATYYRASDHPRAIETTERALKLHRRVLTPEHRQTMRLGNNLAVMYGAAGRTADRERLLRETFDVQRRVLGDSHLDTLTTRISLAFVAFSRGEFESAEAEYAAVILALGEEHRRHWLAGEARRMRGRCLVQLDRLDEAEAPLREAYEIFAEVFGIGHSRTRGAAELLASFHERRGQPELAVEWRSRAEPVPPPVAPPAEPR